MSGALDVELHTAEKKVDWPPTVGSASHLQMSGHAVHYVQCQVPIEGVEAEASHHVAACPLEPPPTQDHWHPPREEFPQAS